MTDIGPSILIVCTIGWTIELAGEVSYLLQLPTMCALMHELDVITGLTKRYARRCVDGES